MFLYLDVAFLMKKATLASPGNSCMRVPSQYQLAIQDQFHAFQTYYRFQQKDVDRSQIQVLIKAILQDLLRSAPSVHILLNKFSVVCINPQNIKNRHSCEYESYKSCYCDTICNYFSFIGIPVKLALWYMVFNGRACCVQYSILCIMQSTPTA